MTLLYGAEEYLINLNLDKILKDKEEVTTYDENDSLENIIMDISTVSMFVDKKTIVIKNHPIFSKNELSKKLIPEIENLENVELIFIVEGEKINKTNPLVKYLIKNGNVQEFSKVDSKDVISTIKRIVENRRGEISNRAAIKLASKLPNSLRILVLEIEKLLKENVSINEKMVEISVGDYFKDDYFALSNAITSSDKNNIISAYNQKLKNNETPINTIAQIASVLNLAKLVSSLRKQGLSNDDISNQIKIHIFRVKKANDLLNSTSLEKIEKLLIQLATLDKDIKTGKIDEQQGMDNFILQLIK